jgi:hypothetical protein
MPPSTGSSAPVTKDAAGDSRNAITWATCSGRPALPSGVSAIDASRNAGAADAFIAVSMNPG